MSNFSLRTADRGTHVKIVILSLVFATVSAGVGITSHLAPESAGLGRASLISLISSITAAPIQNPR
jgi:hypothetical protein